MANKRESDPVESFVKATMLWNELKRPGTTARQWRSANAKINEAYSRILRAGPPTQDRLLALVDGEDPVIAEAAAFHSLKYNTDRSKRALRRLIDEGTSVAESAKNTLEIWERGDWRLDEGMADSTGAIVTYPVRVVQESEPNPARLQAMLLEYANLDDPAAAPFRAMIARSDAHAAAQALIDTGQLPKSQTDEADST